jgi:hypothetical protein
MEITDLGKVKAKKALEQNLAEQDYCINCNFFLILPDYVEQGICRRYPPKLIAHFPVPQQTVSAFPQVGIRVWCGEHRRKEVS